MKSFLQGRKSVPGLALVASLPPAPALLPAMGRVVSPPASGPSVEVVKEGDKVVRLIVTCACGERTEVECLYPAGA